jgi:hypothetical protein
MLDTELSYAEMMGIVYNASDRNLSVGENMLASIYGIQSIHHPHSRLLNLKNRIWTIGFLKNLTGLA